MTESQEIAPYEHRVNRLSHWDRVAFAAFCARLVLPFFGMGLKKVSDARTKLLWNGIAALENSAEKGKPTVDAEKLRTDFNIARGAVRRVVHDRDDESTPTEEEEQSLVISEYVIDICEYVVETLESLEDSSPACLAFDQTEYLLKNVGLDQMLEVTDAALEWLKTHPFKKRRLGRSGVSLKRFRNRIGEIVDSL